MNVTIIYDGQCPICQRLVQASRLKARTDQLTLYDARMLQSTTLAGHDLSGLDFNKGFALIVDDTLYFGAEAAHMLAVLTQKSGLLFTLFKWLNSSSKRSRLSYPLLRLGRRLLLWLLRIPEI